MERYFKITEFSIKFTYKVKVCMFSKLTESSEHYTPTTINKIQPDAQ
jgi:hypothetical protein